MRHRSPDAVKQLPSGLRILDAGDRVTRVEVPYAGLVASDAGANLVDRFPRCLAGHLGIAYQRSGHGASVGLSGGDDELSFLRLVDASRDHDRDVHDVLDPGRQRGSVGAWPAHW